MEQKNIYDEVKDIFENINQWLFFAEAKNASLVAVNIALLNIDCLSFGSKIAISISIIIALISFVPNLTNNKCIKSLATKGAKADTDNMLFYSHICKYDKNEFLSMILRGRNEELNNELNKDNILLRYSEEIVINSIITRIKYFIFGIAIYSTLLGILLEFINSVMTTLLKS